MAETLKTVGQSAPAAATETEMYDVPDSTQFSGKLTVCNRSTTPTKWRLRVKVNNAADDNKQMRFYDQPIGANETQEVPGIALGANDRVVVYALDATLSFNLEGVERT